MTHSFGFKRISGLPSGTVLSCFYLSRIRYFGTSTGNLIIRNENQKFSLKECFISDHYVIEVLRYHNVMVFVLRNHNVIDLYYVIIT